jgi:hypothetical protein
MILMFAIIIEFLFIHCLYLNGDFLFVRILIAEYIGLILRQNINPRLFTNIQNFHFIFGKVNM